jgi:hypothetical protein
MVEHALPRAAEFSFLNLRTSRYVTIDLTEVHARFKFLHIYRVNLFLFSIINIDGWRVVDDDYGQTVGKLQAESMMSTTASLFPQ